MQSELPTKSTKDTKRSDAEEIQNRGLFNRTVMTVAQTSANDSSVGFRVIRDSVGNPSESLRLSISPCTPSELGALCDGIELSNLG